MDDKMTGTSREVHAEIKQDIAEADRDAAMDVAAVNAAERDIAAQAAANEAFNRDVAESQAVDARIQANQANASAREIATERNILHHELDHERAAASNNAFGFYLTLAVLFGVLLFGGYWLYDRYYDRDRVVVAAPPLPSNTTIVTPSPAPSPGAVVPVFVPNPPPANDRPINVTVPAPEVKVNITPPPAQNPPPDSSATDSGTTNP